MFNTYCPWNKGDADGLIPKVYTPAELQEHLMNNLSEDHLKRLQDNAYEICDHSFDETISQLSTLQSKTQKKAARDKDVRELLRRNGIVSSFKEFSPSGQHGIKRVHDSNSGGGHNSGGGE